MDTIYSILLKKVSEKWLVEKRYIVTDDDKKELLLDILELICFVGTVQEYLHNESKLKKYTSPRSDELFITILNMNFPGDLNMSYIFITLGSYAILFYELLNLYENNKDLDMVYKQLEN